MQSWMFWLFLVFAGALFFRLLPTWWSWIPWFLATGTALSWIWGDGYGETLGQVAIWVLGATALGALAPAIWGWMQSPRVFVPALLVAIGVYLLTWHSAILQVAVINLFVVFIILTILGKMVSPIVSPILSFLGLKKKDKKDGGH